MNAPTSKDGFAPRRPMHVEQTNIDSRAFRKWALAARAEYRLRSGPRTARARRRVRRWYRLACHWGDRIYAPRPRWSFTLRFQ